MAQPITLKPPPRDPKQELMTKLEQAPAEHAAALLDGYELLQELHERGVFSLIRGALGATDKIVETASSSANSTEAIRAMRNGVILARMLGSIDPELLQSVSASVGETLGDAKSLRKEPPGLFALLSEFTGSNQRRGLFIISGFLKRLGSRLSSSNHSNPTE
jgi:uncharacterized protein YjgD (DUF1641 family)